MAKSNGIIEDLKGKLTSLSLINIDDGRGKIQFLRQLLITLNQFFFEKRNRREIESLQSGFYKDENGTLPSWKRHTAFLAVWDDYSEQILSFVYPENAITTLAQRLNVIFKRAETLRAIPSRVNPDREHPRFGMMTGRQFVFVRILHALQDFTQILPPINDQFTLRLKSRFHEVPGANILKDNEQALEFLSALGGADRNVQERVRYITDFSSDLIQRFDGDAFLIFDMCNSDARSIYDVLTTFTGIASKKANMILRDFYEAGLWLYKTNLEAVDMIADNRVMRIALRTGIINFALPKLLNDLLDQYDYQYMMTGTCTKEAFRRVWLRCKQLNNDVPVVTYPARFDAFFFRLANASTRQGSIGCCRPTDISCITGRKRQTFFDWLKRELNYDCNSSCPLLGVCPDQSKKLNPPFAIQNNTWNTIFTNEGGGGGLRGI